MSEENLNTTNVSSPFYNSCLGILGSLGILINGSLLLVLCRNKTSEFRTSSSYIIGNLAFCDFLTGVAVLIYITPYADGFLADFQLAMVWTSVEASFLSLAVLSLTRTAALSLTSFSTVVTIQRIRPVLVGIWTFAVSCGVAVYYYSLTAQLALTAIFEVSVVTFLIGQGVILFRSRGIHHNRKEIRNFAWLPKSNRVTGVVFILILVVVVTVVPYMIALQLLFWSDLGLTPALSKSTHDQLKIFVHYFYPVELINFVVNPVIYAWRLKRYRLAFFHTFPILKCPHRLSKRP